MFESVLERNFPPRQVGGGAMLAIGVHAIVIIAALGLAARPNRRQITQDIGDIKVFRPPVRIDFEERSTDATGPARPPAQHAQHHKVWRSTPAEIDNKKRTDDPPTTTSSSNASSSGESVHASPDPGSMSEGTGAVGGEVGSGAVGGHGTTVAIPFGEGMKRPTPLAQPAPVYTREASAMRAAGVVSARCVITMEGTLKDCRILRGVPHMDEAVLEALARWRYTPVTFQGRPVSVYYAINVRLVAP